MYVISTSAVLLLGTVQKLSGVEVYVFCLFAKKYKMRFVKAQGQFPSINLWRVLHFFYEVDEKIN